MSDTSALEQRLGRRFHHPERFDEALTHPSCAAQKAGRPYHYQRLEFLGDTVLGLIAAEILYARFPGESEGAMARRHAALVRTETVAQFAQELKLGEYMRLSPSEAAAGGARNIALLADVGEAVMGALYLDAGLDAVREVLAPFLTRIAEQDVAPPKDAKTSLQEWAQARGHARPTYTIVAETGPSHAPAFTVRAELNLPDGPRHADGTAPVKRAAEQQAAAALLTLLEASS